MGEWSSCRSVSYSKHKARKWIISKGRGHLTFLNKYCCTDRQQLCEGDTEGREPPGQGFSPARTGGQGARHRNLPLRLSSSSRYREREMEDFATFPHLHILLNPDKRKGAWPLKYRGRAPFAYLLHINRTV